MTIEQAYRIARWRRTAGGLNPWKYSPWTILVTIEYPEMRR